MDIKSECQNFEELDENDEDDASNNDNEQLQELQNDEDTTEPEDVRKLFIGGLDYRTTDYGLKMYFEQFGELVDMVVIKDPKTRTSRGFGFVTFAFADMADETLRNGPHIIEGRTVEVKRVVPRNENSNSEAGKAVKHSTVRGVKNKNSNDDSSEPEDVRKLFIGGLDYRTTNEGLQEYFEQYGELVDVVVIKDPKTRTSRGFGFVTYALSRMTDEAYESGPHIVDGRTVEIKRVVPRNEANNSEAGESVNEDGGIEPEYTRKMFVGGLDYKTTNESLKEYFEQYGEIVDVVVIKDPKTKTSRGFGFVKYSKAFMLDKAQENRPHKIDGRTVETKRVVPRNKANSLEDSVTVKKLFVGGLKEDFDEDDIREVFGQFGTILDVIVPMEKDTQKKRGFAFVEFDDYDAVDKACLKKDITVRNKKVEVKKALTKNEMMLVQQENRGVGGPNTSGGPWGGGRTDSSQNNSGGGGPWGGRNNNNNQDNGWFGGNRGGWGNQGNYGGPVGPESPGGFNQGGYNEPRPFPRGPFNDAGPFPRGPFNNGPSPRGPLNNAGPSPRGPFNNPGPFPREPFNNAGPGPRGPFNQGWGGNPGNYGGPDDDWNRGPNNFGNNYGQNFGGGPSRNRQTNRSMPYKTGTKSLT